MKRIITLLLLLILTAGESNGAVSVDMSGYVRRDLFDVRMEAFMKEMRGEFQVMNTKLEALSRRVDDNYHALESRMESQYHALESRMDDMSNYIYWVLVLLGIVVLLPTVQKYLEWRDTRRPSITLEDVKRLIEQNNAELLKTLRS